MNYIEWNNALAKRYFDDVTDDQTFLCITRDTLKDISALPTEEALSDFIRAVKEGPEWTQIDGCRTISSKAHNCLHPYPEWSSQSVRAREKKDLQNHVGWRDWKWGSEQLPYPPYLAYLLLLVLSWTERSDTDHGGQFYDPLNRILDLEGDQRIEALGERYNYNNQQFTFNDLWKDLEDWSLLSQGPVVDLPSPNEYASDYVCIPRYYGLFKASDLRKFDDVFFELSEKNLINERIPREQLVLNIITTREVLHFFSEEGRRELMDPLRRSAIGRLLLSKYRAWDGSPGEDFIGSSRGSHKLLRVIKDGRFNSLIKLRSISAMDKAVIEEGVQYAVDTGLPSDSQRPRAQWPTRSEFSTIFEIPDDNSFDKMEVWITEVGIKARRDASGDRPIIFCKQDLLHLLGSYTEVDQVQAGKSYFLLNKLGHNIDSINNYLQSDHEVQCPAGFKFYRLFVPADIKANVWPDDQLPALSVWRQDPTPRVRVKSIFQTDRDTYLAGCPIEITSTSEDYVPTISNPVNIPKEECGSTLIATPIRKGVLDLSLNPIGANPSRAFHKTISICECGLELADSDKWGRFQSQRNIPSYPEGEILITGNSFLYSKDGNHYYCAGVPIGITHDRLDVESNGSLKINGHIAQVPYTLSGGRVEQGECAVVELLSGNDLIAIKRINFRSKPDIEITGVSLEENHPKVLNNRLTGSVAFAYEANCPEYASCSYLNRRCSISIPYSNFNWLELLTEGGRVDLLPYNHTFELKFILGEFVLKTCWFKTPQAAPPARPVVGCNNLGALFDRAFENRQEGGT